MRLRILSNVRGKKNSHSGSIYKKPGKDKRKGEKFNGAQGKSEPQPKPAFNKSFKIPKLNKAAKAMEEKKEEELSN